MENHFRFGLIGAAGYIAPRHMRAIKEINGELVAAVDPNDNVGVLDTYFRNTDYFNTFERFERHISKLQSADKLNYITVCSPNYLHDTHCRFALQNDCDVICEKPLVLNPWNLDALKLAEQKSDKQINTIMQLRLHPEIIRLKEEVLKNTNGYQNVELTYITSRGPWYNISWKGQEDKSGGITTNIGIHFFDMLIWVFGHPAKTEVHYKSERTAAGFLQFENAEVKWFMSIDDKYLMMTDDDQYSRTYRSLKVNEKVIDFTRGFEDLHTKSYQSIINGHGFTTADIEPVTKLAYEVRNTQIESSAKNKHHLIIQ